MNSTPIPVIRREKEPINNADTERMTMIGRPSLERWDEKAVRCAYESFTTQTEKRWKRMFIALL